MLSYSPIQDIEARKGNREKDEHKLKVGPSDHKTNKHFNVFDTNISHD